ncbi:formate dehydrogenase accessory protein FdhE [Pseudomonas sp. NPDC087358]|uniref:formate dehydrogenase accessory protein FdhE n=1 Tax=Pseudomonas sp. NPDC087358 TaxID=3364439 RepID=UPI00385017E8
MSQILEPEQIKAAASSPPFLYLAPANVFALRGARLEKLAEGHALADYLRLIASLCRVQQDLLDHPPADWAPDSQRLALCREHGLPPLAADSLVREIHWQVFLQALLDRYTPPAQVEIHSALLQFRSAGEGQRKAWAISLLSGQYAGVPAALVPFLGAALQAAWSYWLLKLPQAALKPCDNLSQCPACGSPAMAGVIRHRGAFNGLRYLACSLCACEWHVVRVKCVYCEQSKGLKYVSLDDDRVAVEKAPLRAEVCPGCNSYLKQIYLENDADAEPLSADLASLALDMRLDIEGIKRIAPNLMLAPGAD